MKIREVLAFNLRRLRREKGLTQEDLAGKSGIERDYISKLENAKKEAGLDMLSKLAIGLGVEPVDLLQPPRRAMRR